MFPSERSFDKLFRASHCQQMILKEESWKQINIEWPVRWQKTFFWYNKFVLRLNEKPNQNIFSKIFFSKKNELVKLQAVFPISIETRKCVVKRQTFEKMALSYRSVNWCIALVKGNSEIKDLKNFKTSLLSLKENNIRFP